jgi:hypothetical protein
MKRQPFSPCIHTCRVLACATIGALLLAGCDGPAEPEEGVFASAQAPLTVGGCSCPTSGGCSSVSYSDVPSSHSYYITTFGGGSDTQGMSCGGTADGTWAYIADLARFGCGAKVRIEANGKACVAKVADCGPNKCVEQAASGSCSSHHPIIDASPYITKYLFGKGGMGWSDKKSVIAYKVASTTAIGCPAPAAPTPKPDAAKPKLDAAKPKLDAGAKPHEAGQLAPDSEPAGAADGNASLPPAPSIKAGSSGGSGGCAWAGSPDAGAGTSAPALLLLLALAALACTRRR